MHHRDASQLPVTRQHQRGLRLPTRLRGKRCQQCNTPAASVHRHPTLGLNANSLGLRAMGHTQDPAARRRACLARRACLDRAPTRWRTQPGSLLWACMA
jgi:hypothetical protein